MKYRIYLISLSLVCGLQLNAQDLWYPTLKSIHKTYINPGFMPEKNVSVGLASLAIDAGSGGITLDNITNEVDGQKEISLQKLSTLLNNDVRPYLQTNFHTIDVAIKLGKNAFSFGHGIQLYTHSNIPKGFIDLAAYGNAAFVGQTVTGNIDASVNAFQNFYLGYARSLGKLTVGVRANWLNGMYHFKSKNSTLAFTTSDDYYRLKLESNYDFQSAGLLYYNEFEDEFQIDDEIADNGIFFTGNQGWSVDLGASYGISKDVNVFASVLQLGKINWTERSNRYINQTSYEFIGLDIKDVIDGNTEISVEDSLEQFLDLEKSSESFSAALPTKLNAGVTMTAGKMDYMIGMQWIGLEQKHSANLALSATRTIFNFMRLGLAYQMRPGATANLGALLDLKLGPFRWYTATQNLLQAFTPEKASAFSLITGISLEFGSSPTKPSVTQP